MHFYTSFYTSITHLTILPCSSKIRKCTIWKRVDRRNDPNAPTDPWMIGRKGTDNQTPPFRSYEIQLEDSTTRRRDLKYVRPSAEPPIVKREDDNKDTTWLMKVIRQYWYININHQWRNLHAQQTINWTALTVVVKTRSGRVVVPPVGTVNRTKGINRPFNKWSTCWDCSWCRLYRTKMFCSSTPLHISVNT